MIAWKVVEEIQEMLASGKFTKREIGRRMNVSHSTITRIESGKRQPRRPAARTTQRSGDHDFESPPRRCPDCGGLVYMPCLLCDARLYQDRQKVGVRERSGRDDPRRLPDRERGSAKPGRSPSPNFPRR